VTFFSVSEIVSPLLTGWLTDLFGGFAAAFGALVIFVTTAVLGMLLQIGDIWAVIPRPQ